MAHRSRTEESEESVHAITSVSGRHSEDVDARMRRYALQMGLRLVCLILAVIFEGWLRWVMMIGVVVLPWLAVVWANANHRADPGPGSHATPVQAPALPAQSQTAPPAEPEVIEGEILEDDAAGPGDNAGRGDGSEPGTGDDDGARP